MLSMTGYGKGAATINGRTLTIELKAVNNRYLEINARLPKSMTACEEILKREVGAFVKRGSIDVFFNYENKSEDGRIVSVDLPLAKSYMLAAKKLRDEFLIDNDFNVTALLRSPDVLKVDIATDNADEVKNLVAIATKEAVTALVNMRREEGNAIYADLKMLTDNIISCLAQAVKRSPKVVEDYRKKINDRILQLLQGVDIDQARIVNEVAIFADKCDINEEMQRLTSHISQFLKCLDLDNEPQGRKLDFLSQEMVREINTMGSKSNDTELTNIVVYMKNEMEKIKEQIRNVE